MNKQVNMREPNDHDERLSFIMQVELQKEGQNDDDNEVDNQILIDFQYSRLVLIDWKYKRRQRFRVRCRVFGRLFL